MAPACSSTRYRTSEQQGAMLAIWGPPQAPGSLDFPALRSLSLQPLPRRPHAVKLALHACRTCCSGRERVGLRCKLHSKR
jgi:hypothetical protein